MMYPASQGKVLNDKKTIKENNIEAGTTIQMSEEDLKKCKLMEMCESKPSRPSDDAVFLKEK